MVFSDSRRNSCHNFTQNRKIKSQGLIKLIMFATTQKKSISTNKDTMTDDDHTLMGTWEKVSISPPGQIVVDVPLVGPFPISKSPGANHCKDRRITLTRIKDNDNDDDDNGQQDRIVLRVWKIATIQEIADANDDLDSETDQGKVWNVEETYTVISLASRNKEHITLHLLAVTGNVVSSPQNKLGLLNRLGTSSRIVPEIDPLSKSKRTQTSTKVLLMQLQQTSTGWKQRRLLT